MPKPDGWFVDPEPPQAGFVARWAADRDPNGSWSQFTVNLRPRRGLDPSQAARSWISRGYRMTKAELDGARAVRLDYDPPAGAADVDASRKPTPVYIALNAGMLYSVLFLLDDDAPSDLVDDVLAGWRWIDFEPLAPHLGLGEPVAAFGGPGTLRLPRPVRLDPSLSSDTVNAYQAFDFAGGQDGWLASLEKIAAPPGNKKYALERAAIAYAELIERNTGINTLLTFKPLPGTPHVLACPPITGQFPDGGGGTVTRSNRYAIWQPSPDTLIRLQFVINDEVIYGREQTEAAFAAIDAVLASCSAP
ncbi:MAG: hypothetical protein AAF596_05360 [Planctomycetota bacterium]